MRTNLPRWPLLGLLTVLAAPALAQAQLFPNLPIRRERPDCSHENPQYRMIRQEYWGYYPTCWRKFPPGWGCPAPEPPDWEKSKRDIKLEPPEPIDPANVNPNPDDGGDAGMQPGPGANPPRTNQPARGNDTGLPPVPPDTTSPFDTTPKPPGAGKPAANPNDAPKADAPPPADPPKPPGASTSDPIGDPPKSTAAPARRRTIVAGLFDRRRR